MARKESLPSCPSLKRKLQKGKSLFKESNQVQVWRRVLGTDDNNLAQPDLSCDGQSLWLLQSVFRKFGSCPCLCTSFPSWQSMGSVGSRQVINNTKSVP